MRYTYTVIVQGITPEEAKRPGMEVHLTFGQAWREYVTDAYEAGGGTAVVFQSSANLKELYGTTDFLASVGVAPRGHHNKKEIDLTLPGN